MNKKSIAGFVGLVAALAFATTAMAATFSTNLKLGSTGADVKALQVVLNSDAATQVSATGAGSAGSESSYFGAKTKAAVIKFQIKNGITPAVGFVGPITRAKLNTMNGAVVVVTPVTPADTFSAGCTSASGFSSTTGLSCAAISATTYPAGCSSASGFSTTTGASCSTGVVVTPVVVAVVEGLLVAAGTQPANGLAIATASRVPFTKFTLTAGSSDVVVTGVTVQRTGAAVNAAFSSIVLLKSDGTQLDIAKTLGSTNQAILGGTFTVTAGTSMTLTVAGNMASGSTRAGQVASLTVVAVTTTATVTGLPIVGASHTINETLTIGTVVATNSSYDPGSIQSKAIGTTGYKFTGMRLTAGSGEDVRLMSIRFYQAGLVSSTDLANVKILVDGTSYDTTVSDRYYSANFGSGIVISKGLAKDIWIAGDIVGTGAAGRTVSFDLQKNTDLYITGETYAYGIIYTGTVNTAVSTATPAVLGYVVTVSAGSVTSVSKAISVAAGNVAINLGGQVLGGYETDIKGEPISVQSQVFHFTNTLTQALLTSVSLYDANGAVVSGPVDAVTEGGSNQKVTFTDTVTYPVGKQVYTLKGKIASGAGNGMTLIASTTPSTDWTSATGQTTGNTITISNGLFTMSTMTVRAASLAVAQSATPAAQIIVAGGVAVTFANFQLDASQSGEDVRLSAMPLTTSNYTGLSACQLFDGATALNTSAVTPTTVTPTFTFDSQLTVTKNTVKTLTLKCNVASGLADGTAFTWTAANAQIIVYSITGVDSGTTVVATGASTTGAAQTTGTGTLVVSLDASSPAYTIATAGSTGVTLGVYKFSATNDAVSLTRIGLSLGSATASSTAADFTQVTLWNGSTQVGTATFVGTSRSATSTLAIAVTVPKNDSVVITVKGDLAAQGPSEPSLPGALLTVNVDVLGATGNKNTSGTGVGTGTVVDPTGSTAVSGVRVFRSSPVVAQLTSGMTSTLLAQSGIDLYRFSVTANASREIGLNKVTVNVATSSASTTNGTTTVTGLKVFGYTDSAFSSTIGGSYTAGQVVASIAGVANGDNVAAFITPLTIPAGLTYYFKVTGDITQVAGTTGSAGTVSTKISGDSAYFSPSANLLEVATTASLGNFVWSPISTTTSPTLVNKDWTNGYQVTGLPSGGTGAWTLTK